MQLCSEAGQRPGVESAIPRRSFQVDFGPHYRRWRAILSRLMEMPEEQLGSHDIGGLNLGAAFDLPGAKDLDAPACLEKLDRWAELVRLNTEHWWRKSPASSGEDDHSPGQFRILSMMTLLQRDLGVRYNLAFSEGEYNATDSRDLFLHGVLNGHGGTCVTLPVLYIAIGRRLGYPLKLVEAKEHLFVRWDEPGGERLNIECTSLGFEPRDEYYDLRAKPSSRRWSVRTASVTTQTTFISSPGRRSAGSGKRGRPPRRSAMWSAF